MRHTEIVVIGAGIAGITAAIYLKRANKDFVLLDGDGGCAKLKQLKVIENYPGESSISGQQLASKLLSQLEYLHIQINKEYVQTILKAEEGFEIKTDKESYISKAVILATGNSIVKSNIPGEEEYFGRGVSYCATCDGFFFKHKDVAVVGNNNIALEESLYLSNIVNKVYLIINTKIEGDKTLLTKINKTKNIEIIEKETVREILGADLGVKSIKLTTKEIPVSAVFSYSGKKSTNQLLINLQPLMNNGGVVTNQEMMSNIPGLFCAGDIVDKKVKQLVTAASDGAIAASSCISFIK